MAFVRNDITKFTNGKSKFVFWSSNISQLHSHVRNGMLYNEERRRRMAWHSNNILPTFNRDIEMSKFLQFHLPAIVALALIPTVSLAQRKGPETEKMSAVGELQGLKGDVMFIRTSGGEQWAVKAPKDASKLMFKGAATPAWLKKGMWVQFTANFDAKGVVHGGVNQLLVITPNKETKVGVTQESDLSGGPANLFSDDEPVKSDVKTKIFTVVGRVTGLSSGGELSVTAGRTPVRVKLSDRTQVSVNLLGVQFARPGDKVSVEGWYYPQQPNQAYGNTITVTAGDTLGAKPKKEVEQE